MTIIFILITCAGVFLVVIATIGLHLQGNGGEVARKGPLEDELARAELAVAELAREEASRRSRSGDLAPYMPTMDEDDGSWKAGAPGPAAPAPPAPEPDPERKRDITR